MRDTVRSGLITQTASGDTAMPSPAAANERVEGAARIRWKLDRVGYEPELGSMRETLYGRRSSPPPVSSALPTHTAPAPTAMSVGVDDVLNVLTTVAGLGIDLRDRLVVRVEHPDAALADRDCSGRAAERDAPERLTGLRVERGGPSGGVHRLTAACALVDRSTDGEREDECPRRCDPARMTPRCGRHESGSRRLLGRGELGIVIEDLPLESLQTLAWLEAELLCERAATLLVACSALRPAFPRDRARA